MKVTLPSLTFAKCVNALRLLGLPCLAGLLLSATVLHAATPANPIVELRFSEGPHGTGGAGVTTTNNGTLAGIATFAQPVDPIYETNLAPIFSTNVPVGTFVPAGNAFSVNMGDVTGNSLGGSHGRGVDLTTDLGPFGGTLGGMPGLSICGWINASTLAQGPGGNRIAYALESAGGLGFDLVQRLGGQLALYVNGYATAEPESTGFVTPDASNGSNNWIYFAVTYDPSLGSDQAKFYSGKANRLASLDVARTYAPATTTIDFTGTLTVGNFSTADSGGRDNTGSVSRIFRGLIDELTIYTNVLTLNEIQQAQLNATVPPTGVTFLQQPVNATAAGGQNATFTALANGSGLVTYQWKTNGVNVPDATNASLTLASVQLTESGKTVQVGASNSLGGLLSTTVTLTVIPNDPFVGAFSFTEGESATSTTNVGSLAGLGLLKKAGGFPLLISTNVPSGPYAPNPIYNPGSVNFNTVGANNKAVDLTNTVVSPAGALGSLNALTICGWINSANATFRTTSTGRGNRIINGSKGDTLGGFVLGYRNNSLNGTYGENGRLQFHVNEFNADGNRVSSPDTIPLSSNTAPANWVYFAVTYDGTLTANNLNYYFGDPNNLATNDAVNPITYNKGVIASSGPLTIGHDNISAGNPTGRATGGNPNGSAYRGLMDEIKIFSKVLTLAEIQAEQSAPAVPTLLVLSNAWPNLDLSWETRSIFPYQLQSRTNAASGTWFNVANPQSVSGNVHKVTVSPAISEEYFRINR